MSYPKAGVKLADDLRMSGKVLSTNLNDRSMVVEFQVPSMTGSGYAYLRELIAFDAVLWINTEAADAFELHDLRVIGMGYGADEKIKAYEESKSCH